MHLELNSRQLAKRSFLLQFAKPEHCGTERNFELRRRRKSTPPRPSEDDTEAERDATHF